LKLKKNNRKRKPKGSPRRNLKQKPQPTPTKRTAIPKQEADEVNGLLTGLVIFGGLMMRAEPFIFIVVLIIGTFWALTQ
jgi:hypothetical protein